MINVPIWLFWCLLFNILSVKDLLHYFILLILMQKESSNAHLKHLVLHIYQ